VTTAVAEATVDGVLHDGPIHSVVAISRTSAIEITRPHLTLRVAATPAGGSAPLEVIYRYELVNDSATVVPMLGASVVDDRCGMLVDAEGDTTNPGVLDVGETWSYTCSVRYDAPGTYLNRGVASAGSTVDGRSVTAAPVTSEVLVSAEPASATSVTGAVSGVVPATLSLSLGNSVLFGTFTPGVAMDYLASTTATVTSTAGDASLSVTDRAGSTAGHLVNGGFALPQVLQVTATSRSGTGGAYAPIGGPANPTEVLRYSGPVSNDGVSLGFKQPIAASDALRTGTYSATLTFTLSTSTP
jgi:hypothetical protein